MVPWCDVLVCAERHRELLRMVERHRLVRVARAQRGRRRPWLTALASRIGDLLIRWGTRLQRCSGVSTLPEVPSRCP